MDNIANIRKDYMLRSLSEDEVAQDPIVQFGRWWDDAICSDIDEVNAMTLATVTAEGRPDARIVLLKGFDERGFIFFTNYRSRKGEEVAKVPYATLVFFWKELERQVRIEGSIEMLPAQESDAYFFSRPEASRIGAWASPQSQVIPDRQILEDNVEQLTSTYVNGDIPRPEHWGGYVVRPLQVEFWQGRSSRLHDRIRYRFEAGEWTTERLAP